jgi:Domain of unknown function (DUF4111)/Nucleotidyltransferase domain
MEAHGTGRRLATGTGSGVEWEPPMSPADPTFRPPGAPGAPIRPTGRPGVDRAVERLLDGVVRDLGGDLVGLYLTGSLGLGDFDPASSDVDVLVATAGPLPGRAVEGLRRLHGALRAEGGWAARLEVVYLPLAALRRFDPQDTARYPIGASDREFTLGRQAPTWVLDRWVVREHGLVVTGPDPRQLIDPIGPDELRAAVRASLAGHWALEGRDVAWLRPRNYQAFAVLSMCRDLYVLEHGTVVSKPAAAAWASRRLGPPWPAMIERALAWRSDPRVDDRALPETLAFVAHVVGLAG